MWLDHDKKSLISASSLHRLAFNNPTYQSNPGLSKNRFKQNAHRAILKNGECNITHRNLSTLTIRYIHDLFTSLVDIKWRYCLVIYALAYFVSWLFFALIWWLIMFTHGDLQEEHTPESQAESSWTPCVLNIHNFTSCYLFSLESQFTVGYGVRTITEECPQAIFILCMQAILGMSIDAFFLGIIFAKLTRPKRRTRTILFSKNAVISKLDGRLCLMFRVGDLRKNPLIGVHIRAQVIQPKSTEEGESIKNYTTELKLKVDGGGSQTFFVWPVTVYHIIEEGSPLYCLSASQLLESQFEIVVILEGTVESTGQSIQCRSSYLPHEILWGFKFATMIDLFKRDDAYNVDYSKFNDVEQVEVEHCSAVDLEGGVNGTDDEEVEPPRRGVRGPSRGASGSRYRIYEELPENPVSFTSSYV